MKRAAGETHAILGTELMLLDHVHPGHGQPEAPGGTTTGIRGRARPTVWRQARGGNFH
jgi:hypothetical protein